MTKELTGYPSVDKPWLKYYNKEVVNADMPKCNSYEYILQNNSSNLNEIAIVYYGKKITYGDLFKNIDRCAVALSQLGIHQGSMISVISITTPEFLYCIYAANSIGATLNMIDPRTSTEKIIKQIQETKSELCIMLDACTQSLGEITKHYKDMKVLILSVSSSMGFPIKQLYKAKTSKKDPSYDNCAHNLLYFYELFSHIKNDCIKNISKKSDIAFIFYTGGTTGDSKGVMLTDYQIDSVIEQHKLIIKGFERGQSWLSISAPFSVYSWVTSIHMPLSYGMTCYIELFDPDKLSQKIIKKKYNHVAANPIIWETLMKSKSAVGKDLSFLIAPTSGGDTLSIKAENEINRFLEEHGCSWKLCQGYGMTELASGISLNVCNEINRIGSVGVPFPQTIISTFDGEDELKIGETGEICVSGPSVMKGYFKNKDETDNVLKLHQDGRIWMHTGDLGYVDVDGFVFILGRIKRMIYCAGGWKIYPQVVEDKLREHNMVKDCVVVGMQDPNYETGQVAAAFIIKKDATFSNSELIEELKDLCGKALTTYECPMHYQFIKEFPRTGVGKIDYLKLEKEINY